MRKAKDLPLRNALAAELKARRAAIKINQEELAHRAGVHRSFIALLEVGETQPSLETLFCLAAGLEVDVAELVAGIAQRRSKEMRRRPPRA